MNIPSRKNPPSTHQCRDPSPAAEVDLASLQLELRDGDGDAENGEAAAHGARRRLAEERARACGDFLRLRPKSVVDKERLKESIGQVPYCSETKFNGLQMVSRVIRNRTPQYKDQEVGKIWEQNHFNQAANGPVRMAQVQKPLYLIQH